MTDVLIKRELLEDLRDCANECYNHARFRRTSGLDNYERLTEQADAILAAPRQPEGEGLEVWGNKYRVNFMGQEFLCSDPKGRIVLETIPLCRLSDAQRAIAERDATIERLEAGIPRLQEHAHQMRQQRDRLMAENERLRKSCAGVIARSVHETQAATNSDLDGYLAAGIAATDAELDTLRQQLAEANDDTSRWHEIACKQRKRADGLADQRDKLAGLLSFGRDHVVNARHDVEVRSMNGGEASTLVLAGIDQWLADISVALSKAQPTDSTATGQRNQGGVS